MAINATNSGQQRQLIESGNYIARCYQMIHIGTVSEVILGQQKILNKVRIGWELPTELKVFKEENGEQPCVISKEFTLSMNEKATLRKTLASWRGKDFSEDEAKCFDVTKLLGKPCMLNIIQKPSKDGTKLYNEIAGVTPLPKGFECPPQINENLLWDYDTANMNVFEKLPDFLKDKIKESLEWQALQQPNATHIDSPHSLSEPVDDLPF
jgi:hypothetical protein